MSDNLNYLALFFKYWIPTLLNVIIVDSTIYLEIKLITGIGTCTKSQDVTDYSVARMLAALPFVTIMVCV